MKFWLSVIVLYTYHLLLERESILEFIIFLLGSALWCIILAYVYSDRADRKLADRKNKKNQQKNKPNKQRTYEDLY
ncbi:hypothetical protein LKM13_24195 [Bacillus anthracis]|nr:hypothetical protein [Bacillus anthracis]